MNPALAEALKPVMGPLLKGLATRFPALKREDVEQQAWLGILEKQDELGRLVEDGDTLKAVRDARQYATKAVLALRREQGRHERAVKAIRAGYRPEDEAFYSPGLLRKLLPAYLDNGVTPDPPKGRENVPSSSDPAESGNWLAMMIDVDYAYWKLRTHHRSVLSRYFSYPQGAGGWTHIEIANAMGIPPGALEGRIKRALRSMEFLLGGSDPRSAKHEGAARHG